MIGDMLNTNKRREVCTRADQLMYMGKKYRREKSTGYYVCTTGARRRLHDIIWETGAGREIPPGCVIHHVNWDKSVNVIENLVCVTVAEHERIHNATNAQIRAGGRWEGVWRKVKKRERDRCPSRFRRGCEVNVAFILKAH